MSDNGAAVAAGIKGEVRVLEPDRGERTVARRSAESRATIPSVEYAAEITVDGLVADGRERDSGNGSGVTARWLAAVAHGLRAVGRVNASYRDGHFELYSRVNIGLTVSTPELYLIPTIFDADAKSIDELALDVDELRSKALAGELSPAELSGATFTLTDAGADVAAVLSPLIVPPQAAALCIGPITERPVVRGGDVVPGYTTLLTLACDHRIVYGAHATAFLEAVRTHLEEETC